MSDSELLALDRAFVKYYKGEPFTEEQTEFLNLHWNLDGANFGGDLGTFFEYYGYTNDGELTDKGALLIAPADPEPVEDNKRALMLQLLNADIKISIKDFLQGFGYTGDTVKYYRAFYDPEKDDKEHKAKKREGKDYPVEWLQQLNKDNYGIYFVVNGGGHGGAEVVNTGKVRAQFMEIDDAPGLEAGSEEAFLYQLEKIMSFPLAPSAIVKTRKSLHTYWFIDKGDIFLFRSIQQMLVDHFGGDSSIKDESRVMRLPGFNHCKKPEDPKRVKVIYWKQNARYSQKQVLQALFTVGVDLRTATRPDVGVTLDKVKAAYKKIGYTAENSATAYTTGTAFTTNGEIIRKGTQHKTLVSKIGSLANIGLSENEILQAIQTINAERLEEPDTPENIASKYGPLIHEWVLASVDERKELYKRETRKTEPEDDKPAGPDELPQAVDVCDILAEFLATDPKAQTETDIKTGFKFLDDPDGNFAGGLKYGTLYMLGAGSNAGKTSFCLQLAEQIARIDTPVLFFSMEQTAQEMTAKIISRYTFLQNGATGARNNRGKNYHTASTTAEVLAKHKYKDYPAEKLEAIRRASKTTAEVLNGNLRIIGGKWFGKPERRRALSPKAVRKTIEHYTAILGHTPVVFLDYLQLLEPDGNQRDAVKQLDEVVADLVQVAKDLNIAFVCISSYNREANKNTTATADMTAFRGSGMIEYSSDVLLQMGATWDRYLMYDKSRETPAEDGGKPEKLPPGYYLKPNAAAILRNAGRTEQEIKDFEAMQNEYRKRWNLATGEFSDIGGGLAPYQALQIDFKCSKSRNGRKSVNPLYFVPAYNLFIEAAHYIDYSTEGKSPEQNATRSVSLFYAGMEDASKQTVFADPEEPAGKQAELFEYV